VVVIVIQKGGAAAELRLIDAGLLGNVLEGAVPPVAVEHVGAAIDNVKVQEVVVVVVAENGVQAQAGMATPLASVTSSNRPLPRFR